MRIVIDEEQRLAEIWLSNTERADAALRASLTPLFQEWKARRYLPVVYESGTNDLRQSVACFLKHQLELRAGQE